MNYPTEFKEKMKKLLADEYEAFEASYEKPRKRGLRVNEHKLSTEEFAKRSPFPLEPIPWVKNGFFYPDEVRPARHPYYAAGLYYLQEPSAMTPASRLPLEAGDRVLDLCAAPGGKATELAARLSVLDASDRGLLVANDISPQRTRALLHNLEMMGTDNYCVLNESPERIAEAFPEFFDKILVDAPCSGEGMFRKEEEALRLWSPERVADFAAQQKKILAEAYTMLKPGGMLLYSTCTFAPEENEQQIADFLQMHPDMKLQDIEPYEGFSQGRPDWVRSEKRDKNPEQEREKDSAKNCSLEELKKCVRIWPHKMDGEGHFLALMKKSKGMPAEEITAYGTEHTMIGDTMTGQAMTGQEPEAGVDNVRNNTDRKRKEGRKNRGKKELKKKTGKNAAGQNRPDKDQLRLLKEFLCAITDTAAAEALCSRVEKRQDKAFLPAAVSDKLNGLHVVRGGVYIGEWKKNRFEPSQTWAMVQKNVLRESDREQNRDEQGPQAGLLNHTVLALSADDRRLKQYLAGESFPAEEMPDGWALVCADGFPVGWAKVVRGIAKNHYPVSWRIPG